MADFYKDNFKEGMTVYLLYTGYDLCVGKYAPRKKYSITEGIISEMGKNYLKVNTEGQKACFGFNEETGQIWQDPKESDSVYGLEIYGKKETAKEAAIRYKLIKETSVLIGSISCLLDRYPVRDLKILNNFAKMVNSERTSLGHTMEGFLDTLPSDIKDSFYRKIWAEHVYEDIRGMDKKVSKKRAEKVSGAYANGRYDCNLSYWDNLNNLLEEIPEEQTPLVDGDGNDGAVDIEESETPLANTAEDESTVSGDVDGKDADLAAQEIDAASVPVAVPVIGGITAVFVVGLIVFLIYKNRKKSK